MKHFNVGQEVEMKTFEKGFRGAWFRCKIEDVAITSSTSFQKFLLTSLDYPDEEKSWVEEYEWAEINGVTRLEHMIRPLPPSVVTNNDSSHGSFETVVVIKGEYEVGDKVDWLCNGCWWSSTITKKTRNSILVSLPSPDIGEGGTFKAVMSRLRPSLVWTKDQNWRLEQNTQNIEIISLIECSLPKWNALRKLASVDCHCVSNGNLHCELHTQFCTKR